MSLGIVMDENNEHLRNSISGIAFHLQFIFNNGFSVTVRVYAGIGGTRPGRISAVNGPARPGARAILSQTRLIIAYHSV